MKNPCRYCEKRQLGCHGTCPDYAAFKEKLERAKEVKRQELNADNFILRPVPSKRNRKIMK
jgi:hypothetical protein